MKWLSRLSVGLVLLGAFALLGTEVNAQKAKAGKTHTVEIVDFTYKPRDLTIAVGDSVVWVNKCKSCRHTATSDDRKTFDTGPIRGNDKSKVITFTKPGKFPYHCEIHPNMKGSITVAK
jgi:plastocyanin